MRAKAHTEGARRGSDGAAPARLAPARAGLAVALLTGVLAWRHGLPPPSVLQLSLPAGLAAAAASLATAARRRPAGATPSPALAEALRRLADVPDASAALDLPTDGEGGEPAAAFNQLLAALRAKAAAAAERPAAPARADPDPAPSPAPAVPAEAAPVASTSAVPALRAPLAGLAALAERLAGADLAPGARRQAEVLARSAASQLALVDDLAAAAPPPLATAPADPAEVVEDVVALHWASARAKGLDLAAHIDPATPALIETDPARLRWLVGALVGHAVGATETGAVAIQAAARGEVLRLAVRSAGAGKGQLAGLGACRRLAAAMGGRIAVASEPGKGSIFTLELPLKAAAPPPAWPRLANETAQLRLAAPAGRASLQRYLAAAGLQVVAGETAEPAGLIIAEAAALKDATRSRSPVICLAEPGDAEPLALLEAGLVDLVLEQPLRRADLAAALAQAAAGAPLSEALAAPPAADAAPAAAKPALRPMTATVSPGVASDLLDPQVTSELARMAAAGNGDFVARVRRLYRDNAPEAVKALIAACTNRDCLAAAKAANALKSMSLNMGARLVAETASRLEAQARDLGVVNVDQAQILHRQLLATLDVLEGYPPEVRPTLVADAAPDEEALLADLSQAIERDELTLVYQPQFDREGLSITGIETLVRWTHPTRGFVSPAFFIPIAERYGLIGRVTQWVLARAMRETKDLGDFTIGFNASAMEFADPAFVDELAVLIARCGFDPRRLEIEVTETAVLAEEDGVRRNMARLHELGLKIALDDFGVGYSSLSHLRLFPFDKLKIDRAFVTGCAENVQSATLVHAVVSIGRALGMKVVAEGVETEEQRKFLKVAGVHAMQGYLFAKPEPVEALKARIAALNAPEAVSA